MPAIVFLFAGMARSYNALRAIRGHGPLLHAIHHARRINVLRRHTRILLQNDDRLDLCRAGLYDSEKNRAPSAQTREEPRIQTNKSTAGCIPQRRVSSSRLKPHFQQAHART
jgi:hypothetical protein